MGKLGISIYPEKTTTEEIYAYMNRAAAHGFSRIFSCLLSVTDTKEQLIKTFKEMNDHAHQLGFEVIVDVSPSVFSELDISYNDLSFFKEIGADGLRLDLSFTGVEESLMTFNPQGLKIELNMSQDVPYVDTVMSYMPYKENLIACHNFYPHRYSGLNLEHFTSCNDRFKKYGLRTAAFVTSGEANTFGPWPVTDGLPTLESHRNLPIEVQGKHFVVMGGIDDLIISNCYPSEQELKKLASIRRDCVSFDFIPYVELPEVERRILFDELHFNRGDISDYMIRSTQSRVKYKGHEFKLFHEHQTIKRGDVIIESSEYGHYAGELQIALKTMKNSGKSNVVGRIREEELFLLDHLKPWQKFTFQLHEREFKK